MMTQARPATLRALAACAALLASVGVGCARPPAWVSPVERGHPLVGRIWDAGAGRFTRPDDVYGRARQARYVLLGEKHDNVDHHRLQTRVLGELMAQGRRPDVVFEMISIDRADALAAHLAEHPGDSAGLGATLEWERSGWPDWETNYRPIAAVALEGGSVLVAGNLPRKAVRGMRAHRFGSDRSAALAELGLEQPVPEDVREVLLAELRHAHCGMAPGPTLQLLVEVQHARDLQLVRSMSAAGEQGAVLIAGAGHVRRTIAVPRFLDGPSLVLAFVEVRAGRTDPASYVPGGEFDLVWFTPRVDDVDPCERFRERLRDRFQESEKQTH
jgi:uncharacterized iron-regulated protein